MTRPRVTEAESVLLKLLWSHGPLPSKLLLEQVRRQQDWGDATIKTLLNRLMRKGAIRPDRTGDLTVYVPSLSQADYVQDEVQDLVDRVFGGDQDRLRQFLSGGPD